MKIGIVGYQGSGKSTLFEWLSGVAADPALAHATQSEMVPVPDERMAPLCEIYQPKKITLIVGIVKNGRAYRVHTSASKTKLDDAKRTHAGFLNTIRIGR